MCAESTAGPLLLTTLAPATTPLPLSTFDFFFDTRWDESAHERVPQPESAG